MRAISRRNDDPERASRPFDGERDGFVMGEAGGDGRARGAGARKGARREDLRGAARLRASLRRERTSPIRTRAGKPGAGPDDGVLATPASTPEDIGYVNAHGTSTPSGDSGETRVLKVALGEDKAYRTPVSSTKGATGHCLGAAGAVEAIFTILALERGMLPPTINQTTPDPTCDLDYIPNEARHEQVEIGVSNSFGFGGHNACLVFRRWHEGTDGPSGDPERSAVRPGAPRGRRATGLLGSA